MQIANIMLSLGGDNGNTIPKFAVTAAEIAVLRAIHGDESVNDIEPIGDVKRSNREERARLGAIYGGAKVPNTQTPIVETMFPGVAARVFETLDELELDDSFFKATGRLSAKSPSPAVAEAPAEIEAQTEAQEADEGVGDDINDGIGETDGGKPEGDTNLFG
ncbi:MAG: hypothetical protein PS018_11455 [bacterium]|nr:hypothetical protein [bacterium]